MVRSLEKTMSHIEEKKFDQSLGNALLTNLLLLGFDPTDAKHKVKIDSESFKVPNHKAFQVVSHFLLLRFDPSKNAEIATCWPICSRKEERQFRSICFSFFRSLMDEDPCAKFTHFSATLFLSPGGYQFCLLYVAISSYLLVKTIREKYPHERFIPFPKNSISVDVLLSSTILEVNKCESTHKAIKDVAGSFDACLHLQSAAYWKVSSARQSLEKEMEKEGISVAGIKIAEHCYEQKDKDGMDSLTQLQTEWKQVDDLAKQAAEFSRITEAAVCCEEGHATLDISDAKIGKIAEHYYEQKDKDELDYSTEPTMVQREREKVDDLSNRAAELRTTEAALCCEEGHATFDGSDAKIRNISKLVKPLVTLTKTVSALREHFSEVPDALLYNEKALFHKNENLHQMEDNFSHVLKSHLSSMLREEYDNKEHDVSCELLQATPELHGKIEEKSFRRV